MRLFIVKVMTCIVMLTAGATLAIHENVPQREPQSPLKDDVRKQLDRILELLAEQADQTNDGTEKAIEKAMSELYALAPGTPELLLPQVLWYQLHETQSEREQWSFLIVVGKLRQNIRSDRLIEAVVAYLDTSDVEFRKELADILTNELQTPCGTYNLSKLDGLFKGKSPDDYRCLIAFLYDHAPAQSVKYLLGKQRPLYDAQKPIIWSAHVIEDFLWRRQNGFMEEAKTIQPEAFQELDKLLQNQEWWIRLYVVEMLKQNPTLRSDELIALLLADQDESVRSATLAFVTNK